MSIFKEVVYKELLSRIKERFENLNYLIKSAKESRDNDSKSSVGDKHETSRAKTQTDIDNYYRQLVNLQSQINILKNIDLSIKYTKISQGAFIETNHGYFFISIGFGKLIIENKKIFAISIISPIGMAMKDKLVSQHFYFKDSAYFNSQYFLVFVYF